MDERNFMCGICTNKCILSARVENGVLQGVGRPEEDALRGFGGSPCVRGAATADYVSRPDRLLYPLRRIGARGEGRFERISWDEALSEIAERLTGIRDAHGADAVAFFSGYSKWYRPMLRRLAVSFGSVNYGTESSSCHRATVLAARCDTGFQTRPDYARAGVLLAFARARLLPAAKQAKARGMKIIVADPRCSRDIADYADLHLRLRPGTDAALAAGIAACLIRSGAADRDYIEKYVSGFADYADYVSAFTPEETERLTGVPAADVRAAAAMIAENLPLAIFEGFTGAIHHRSGVQIMRAWSALSAITGCWGRPGGNLPVGPLLENGHTPYAYRELAFSHPREEERSGLIGGARFPVWAEMLDECQAMEFPNAAKRGELRSIFACGFNARMFPDSGAIFDMLKALDFFVDCDLWMSDSAKYADIVLPVCASCERDWVTLNKACSKIWFSHRAVEPPGEARDDESILIALAQAMKLDDPLLTAGREECWKWKLEGTGVTLEQLTASPVPLELPAQPRPDPLKTGFLTPGGRYELASQTLAAHGLDPLPVFREPLEGQDRDAYPFILMAGVRTDRYAHAFHSRTHTVPALRARREQAALDITPQDAAALGLQKGDRVRLATAFGALTLPVDLDAELLPGTCNLFHGYSEADVNSLIPGDYLDPCSGFPGYKAIACNITKLS